MRATLFLLFCSLSLFAADESKEKHASIENGYTINYDTVSIVEYLRFASKICKVNFIYDETDLNFNVTVLSDEPVTEQNVMATLLQVLRIHGLLLLEQDGNLVIHKSADVSQIATLVTETGPTTKAPIITRIFRIKNTKPESLAAIIRPMISKAALLETSPDTRQLILTDITANVEKIAALIENLDSPHTLFDIKTFEAKHNKPEFLIELASQIMNPVAVGNPFILVPQSLANSIFIVSTPELTEKALTVFASLDTVPKDGGPTGRNLRGENVFVYQVVNRSGSDVLKGLSSLAAGLQHSGVRDPDLKATIENAKWIPETNTLLFVGSPDSITKTKEFLAALDSPTGDSGKFSLSGAAIGRTNFYLYKVQYASRDKTENYLNQISQNLSKKGGNDALVEALRSHKWIPESQSFMFSGNDAALAEVKNLLTTFDTPELASKPSYYIYKVQNTTGDQIEDELDNLAKNFKASGIQDTKVLDVIAKIRYVKETNSLLLTGDSNAIEEVKKIIVQYDHPQVTSRIASNFFMYKPKSLPANQIQKSLQDIAVNLKKANLVDPSLLTTIDTSKYVETTNSLIFTGTPDTLQKVQALIVDVDVPSSANNPIQQIGKSNFLLYKLKNASGPQIVGSLKNMTTDLKKAGGADKDFLAALNTVKYVKESNSLLFTGDETALKKVQEFVEKLDASTIPQAKGDSPLGSFSNYFVYKPVALPGPDLIKILNDFVENLKTSGLNDPDLYTTVATLRWMDQTNSVIFTGTAKGIDEVKALLTQFDIASNLQPGSSLNPLSPSIQSIENTNFLVYKLQFHKGDEIQSALHQIGKDLIDTAAPVNKNLLNSINSIQWLEVTNSLLTSGDQETLTRLRELIKNLDIPLKQVFIEMLVVETSLTNALNFGLQWGGNYKYRNKFAGTSSNTYPPASGNTYSAVSPFDSLGTLAPPKTPTVSMVPGQGTGAFDLGIIGEVIRHNGDTFLTLGSLLSALQTDTETSIVMTPKILTQDGRTSTIFQGSNIPFAGSFVQNNTGSVSVLSTTNIEYRDIGLSLTITPVLGNSDIVTLDINLDRSQTLTDVNNQTLTPGTNNVNGIVTSKTSMQTTVHVPDNNFLILSGMVNNSTVKSKSGVPCLGGLPLIGAAFSKANDTQSNTNIVIFIRPHILNSLEDMRQVTSTQEDYFRDQASTPFLEHNYNESMELIKTIDDD